jgi:aryl-alcohol dehydrogenase-like predicted oxidoreductase
MNLQDYRPLGRSGLIVSPLTLGTMTFGTGRWGADENQSRAIFNAYVEAGGNSIDTADVYSGGASEEMTGRFIRERGLRDRIVLATKAGFGTGDHPHSGGAGAKHVKAALEDSLRRMGVEHVDLYWSHVWDGFTPPEELLATMTGLTRAGKIRYWGLSNYPAWYAAKIAVLAGQGHGAAPVALQYEYSLAERGVEAELVAMARDCGMALMPWSPLAGGFLTGKYDRRNAANQAGSRGPSLPDGAPDDGEETDRLSGDNPFGDSKFTERNWEILDALASISEQVGVPLAQIALNWLSRRPLVGSIVIGASRPEQLRGNIAALETPLTGEQVEFLNAASAPRHSYPAALFTPRLTRFIFGGADVRAA